MLAPDLFGLRFEQGYVFSDGGGKRMVTRVPPVLLFIEAQQGKIDHPEEVEPIGRNRQLALRPQYLGAIEPDFAENFTRREPLVCCKENKIAFLDLQTRLKRRFFRVTEKLHNG